MPDFLYIVWLPAVIAGMAVIWVVAIGAAGQPVNILEENLPLAEVKKPEIT